MERVELLCPAQNLKSIKAVKDYADAVYFGVETLNMRMAAKNINIQNLPEVVDFCHKNGLKAYLTTNVIIYENELNYLENQIKAAKNSGIDAVILHDMATLQIAREIGIPFHISTQTSVSNSKAARFYESLGAERIILARECSLEKIKEIASKMKKAKIETFIHGAQCTSISGRCYFSAYVYDDPLYSANRGKCLQPCRHKWKLVHSNGTELDYHEGYFLNSKDMCMIEHIPELIEANISSFKIEGRMRDPHYIETVSRCYREAIDSYYDGTLNQKKVLDWFSDLKSVYNRGFSTGFYFGQPDIEDISVNSSGNQATSKKIQIGKVITYYRNIGVVKVQLHQGILRVGDEIIFEGSKQGTYLNQKIKSMQIKTKSVTITPRIKDDSSILVSIKVDKPVKKNSWIYVYI